MTWELFDTHAHLDSDQFADAALIVERAHAAGVTRMLAVATTAASSQACLQFAESLPGVWASAGIHPNHTHEVAKHDWDYVANLATRKEVVALGETGLDKFHQFAPFPLQQDYFDRQIRLSQSLHKPFIVHMRECADDVMQMLRAARQRGPLTGIMHSFTGSVEMARECIELGLFISFAGMVTFKKSEELRAVATMVPDEWLLVETDAPYLAPHPHRGQRPNEPALVVHTAQCLADERGVTLEVLARQTTANARRLLGV